MKITNYIENSYQTLFSFEILPLLKGKSIQSIYDGSDSLMEFNPKFVNVTYHREEFLYKEKENGLLEKVPCVHYYTMSNSDSVKPIASKIF
jgi:methylenetetrahydrofolate reductase (NADPH)